MSAQAAVAAPVPQVLPPKTKKCKKCSEVKGPGDFAQDLRARDGLRSSCKECDNVQAREKRAIEAHREQVAEEIAADSSKSSDEMVVAYVRAGFSYAEVAAKVDGHTPADVEDTLARALATTVEPLTREMERQKTVLRLKRLADQAEEKGDIKEARLCEMDKLRAVGVIQQGGPAMKFEFNTTNNVLESRLEAWEKKNFIDAEVVDESTPQLPSGADDSPG